MNPNLEFFKRREEKVTIGGNTFIVRELATAADLAAMKDDPDYSMKILILCVFMEDGSQAFADSDIPDMKQSTALSKMLELVKAVHRVNGMDAEAEIKNSDAAPTGG